MHAMPTNQTGRLRRNPISRQLRLKTFEAGAAAEFCATDASAAKQLRAEGQKHGLSRHLGAFSSTLLSSVTMPLLYSTISALTATLRNFCGRTPWPSFPCPFPCGGAAPSVGSAYLVC